LLLKGLLVTLTLALVLDLGLGLVQMITLQHLHNLGRPTMTIAQIQRLPSVSQITFRLSRLTNHQDCSTLWMQGHRGGLQRPPIVLEIGDPMRRSHPCAPKCRVHIDSKREPRLAALESASTPLSTDSRSEPLVACRSSLHKIEALQLQ
jgi:hypothetical protein